MENQSNCKRKVQGEGNCPTLTYHPNSDCTHESNPYPHCSHFYWIHPNACHEIGKHIHSSDCIQFSTGKIPYPTGRPQVEENPFAPNCSPPQPDVIPNAPTFQVREDTLWPKTVPASTNLFNARADWPIPPMQTPTMKVEKAEVPPRVAEIPHAMVLPKPQNNKPVEEKCTWDCIAPFAERNNKKAQKIGMATDWKISRGTTTHKTPSTPKPIIFPIGVQNRSG